MGQPHPGKKLNSRPKVGIPWECFPSQEEHLSSPELGLAHAQGWMDFRGSWGGSRKQEQSFSSWTPKGPHLWPAEKSWAGAIVALGRSQREGKGATPQGGCAFWLWGLYSLLFGGLFGMRVFGRTVFRGPFVLFGDFELFLHDFRDGSSFFGDILLLLRAPTLLLGSEGALVAEVRSLHSAARWRTCPPLSLRLPFPVFLASAFSLKSLWEIRLALQNCSKFNKG